MNEILTSFLARAFEIKFVWNLLVPPKKRLEILNTDAVKNLISSKTFISYYFYLKRNRLHQKIHKRH